MMNELIDLKNIKQVSRGNKDRMEKYLRQFASLIPERTEMIREALDSKDRAQVRQLIHKMSPQIQFFGMDEVVELKNQLEMGYLKMDFQDLENMVNRLLEQLSMALVEVNDLLTDDKL
ncbi:MAG: Hpt domain-containing protein [Bacteroidota bacterium]